MRLFGHTIGREMTDEVTNTAGEDKAIRISEWEFTYGQR